jgi:hypothetical protein
MLATALGSYVQVLGSFETGNLLWMTAVFKVPVDSRLSEHALTIPVRILFGDHWVKIPPAIWPAESFPWFRAGADWHVYLDHRVCYEFDDRWTEHLTELEEKGEPDSADLAAQWLVNGARQVFHVQFTCHKLGIKTWPEEAAPSWPHGEGNPARHLYQQEKLEYQKGPK